ncbi:MAG TPA: lytic murein transglycosylase [Xanthobacteraceae bacterium]
MNFPITSIRCLLVAVAVATAPGTVSADPAFDKFVQSLWPQAQQLGISRTTFDTATRGIEPDLSLPDLDIPGRVEKPPVQPEFVQTPAEYVSEKAIARYAEQGRPLAAELRETFARIEREYGVPGNVLLAIWARETAFGGYKLPHNAVRVLATQAYLGRRKDRFRKEFLQALKILEEGHVKLADMRSSWAGAMGHMQFLPSDFFKHAVDFDGDGKRDVWRSVPDALASAANQLVDKGWQRGHRWAHEVRVPANFDCTKAEPGFVLTVREWVRRGFALTHGRKFSDADLAEQASLLMPEGKYGPAFLTPKNYFVLKDYNFSDLYVLFVGHLSDRISGARPFETPWSKADQLRTAQVEEMQRILSAKGIYTDKIDGKAGMLTRAALGEYQKANGLKLDCWPTSAVLQHMRGRAAKK